MLNVIVLQKQEPVNRDAFDGLGAERSVVADMFPTTRCGILRTGRVVTFYVKVNPAAASLVTHCCS